MRFPLYECIGSVYFFHIYHIRKILTYKKKNPENWCCVDLFSTITNYYYLLLLLLIKIIINIIIINNNLIQSSCILAVDLDNSVWEKDSTPQIQNLTLMCLKKKKKTLRRVGGRWFLVKKKKKKELEYCVFCFFSFIAATQQ